MNRKMKDSLRAAFEAPPPERKAAFILSAAFPRETRLGFVFAQAGYIRKRVWLAGLLAAAGLLALGLAKGFASYASLPIGIWTDSADYIGAVSSLLPFAVLAGITEIARSASCHMSELEMSCRHSLSDVILTRLGLLGGMNAVIFLAAVIAGHGAGGFGLLRIGMYLFVPFLLTCACSLFILNRLRVREGMYTCGAVTGLVCLTNAVLTFATRHRAVYSDANLPFWVAALCVLLIITAKEAVKFIPRTEELTWNWSWTA